MEKLKMHTPDFTQENIAKLAELFPNCVTETTDEYGALQRAIDFDQLRQELSDHVVDGPRERYRLDWPGKRESLLAANAPIAKTLRPSREESVDFDTTKNLFIEGDNLNVLKLLQETLLNKVKMIYIDPPYNTGNDFVYNDDFSTDAKGYFNRSGQTVESGERLLSNTEANGRFHSDWLSMMFSRLRLSRSLLRDDGLILISIDDQEVHNLRKMCDEIFGGEKFLACFIWKSRQNKDNRTTTGASVDHEYILCYGKELRGDKRNYDQYRNTDNDPRGDWSSANMVGIATKDRRPNLHYDLIDPSTGINYGCPEMGWRYERNTMSRLIAEDKILWPAERHGRPRRKAFLSELDSAFTGYSTIIGAGIFTRDGTEDITKLFEARVFTFPKPVKLLTELIEQGTSGDDIVLDFFAGSGTTAEAVMKKNIEDGARRQFVLVQLPEHLDPVDPNQKTAADFCDKLGKNRLISELSKERIRRAGKKLKDEAGLHGQNLDIGFRVLKVDTSNMRDVYYKPDEIRKDDLFDHVENIKEDRTPEDLLFQVLLDWGVDLSLPIAQEIIDGKAVFFVDGNALAACFDTGITEDLVKKIAARKPLRVVFRDAGFSDDSVKINVDQIFKLMSPDTEVKTL
jgi:adenine-specific DNA-methyltransferase